MSTSTQSGFEVPAGWSANPSDLDEATEYFPKDAYKLDPKATVKPLLSDKSPAACFLLEISKEYYIWNSISDAVWKIKAPTTLKDITPKLADSQMKGITLEAVQHVPGPKVAMGKAVEV
ncbi:hypothetical protein MMC24_005988 [Lignoscripta atroalba]|nr:hypothetical protein [Lignoscripta atroalba]